MVEEWIGLIGSIRLMGLMGLMGLTGLIRQSYKSNKSHKSSNSRSDPERLLVKRSLAERRGKDRFARFFAPIFLPGPLARVCALQTVNCYHKSYRSYKRHPQEVGK